ncbi:MAG: hypothetical protein KDE19_13460 [Caldilineaceae bacterium]|nr:hypothetical protein [Caldilineaceae bacterium]
MQLSKSDADLFFKLMWSLQHFVNQQLAIQPQADSLRAYQALPGADKMAVRDALYDHIELIDQYLAQNPQNFAAEELAIVESWKHFERGDFFIERLLKRYAIFIKGDEVYGVLGLYDALDDMFPKNMLPLYVKAVLLPFKGQIIYDGLLKPYSIFFGGGIKGDLRETYMIAKQNGGIIESLAGSPSVEQPARESKPAQDWGPTIATLTTEANKLRATSDSPAMQSPAFSLARAGVELAKLAVEQPDDVEALETALKKVERALKRATTVVERMAAW